MLLSSTVTHDNTQYYSVCVFSIANEKNVLNEKTLSLKKKWKSLFTVVRIAI